MNSFVVDDTNSIGRVDDGDGDSDTRLLLVVTGGSTEKPDDDLT